MGTLEVGGRVKMSSAYEMHLASLGDLDDVMTLLDQRIQWLRDQGSDQWNVGRTFRNRMINSIDRGETWLMREGNEPVGTLSLSPDGDPDFWTPRELKEPALYLGKMASSLSRRGQKLGVKMIQWSREWAGIKNMNYVRWDVWRTNAELQQYYRAIGGNYLRTVEVADRWSGALFQVSAVSVGVTTITTVGAA
jgi:hypothetical protein